MPPQPVNRPRAGQSIDYSNQAYWAARFSQEPKFEWLTSPSGLSSHISSALQPSSDSEAGPSKILHIGCGNSELSLELRRLAPEGVEISNVDYAEPALSRMREAEIAAFGDNKMRWEVVNLLDWDETRAVLGHGPASQLEKLLIVDKSCADAIACGEDTETPLNTSESPKIHPLEALALHLGAVAAPGSIWLALSYSSGRFDFLQPSGGSKIRHFWELVSTENIPAQTGLDIQSRTNVHAPEVYHTLFTLRRISESDYVKR